MTQISNKDTVKVFQLKERNEIFALRKGQEVLFTISRLNGLEAATAVCVISTQTTPVIDNSKPTSDRFD